jgi:hypothetical protein
LILGDNGGGKSSILRALAIAVLAPALLRSGFVPYRLVRRQAPNAPPVSHCLLKVRGITDKHERKEGLNGAIELLARIEAPTRGSLDRLTLEYASKNPIELLLDDEFSSAFFVVGYGATRRVETADYFESSHRRSRGPRYQRIAGLFEDHVALRPLSSWLLRLKRDSERFKEAVTLIDRVLPDNIHFDGTYLEEDEQFIFTFEDVPTPFTALSDGYRAFIGWVGDLVGHLVDVAVDDLPLNKIAGIVLVDEIDLHLHPTWQREVIPLLSKGFPCLQFVLTTHSPLVASSVKRENVFVTGRSEAGTATIQQLREHIFGRGAEQVLLSSYFGLTTTRAEGFESDAEGLFTKAAAGDSAAALEFLKRLTGPTRQAS